MRFLVRGTMVLLLAQAGLPCAARAQTPPEPQTRADAQRQAREEKQKHLAPYEPDGLERALDLAENRIVPLLQRDGLFAKMGGISTGSGFAYGGGYRDRSLIGRRGSGEVWGAISLRRYWALEGRVRYPLVASARLEVEGYARRYSYPQEDFFGLGQDSRRADRVNFSLRGEYAGARLHAKPAKALSLAAGLEFQRPRVGAGTSGSLPSIGAIFDDVNTPGLARQPNFLRRSLSAEIDYRRPLNARRGGFYRVDLNQFVDRATGEFTFTRTDVDLRQYVSFLNERRVLAGRLWMSMSDVDPARRMPFYFMPALGGNDTLRGFRARRFYGPHAILVQGEYRWEIWSGFEAALFYDAGKVTLRRADLDLRGLERDYGFGFRFNTDNGVVMRVDAAFGSRDGKHLHVVFGGIF